MLNRANWCRHRIELRRRLSRPGGLAHPKHAVFPTGRCQIAAQIRDGTNPGGVPSQLAEKRAAGHVPDADDAVDAAADSELRARAGAGRAGY